MTESGSTGSNAGADDFAGADVSTADDDLQAAITGLSRLTMGPSLDTSLARIAVLAVKAIPGADGAGVTMLEPGHVQSIAVSDPFVGAVDEIQYSLGQGPCITAAAESRVVLSGSLGGDPEWPEFGPRVEALGVNSVVSLPLVIDGQVVGALNVYAHDHDVFDEFAAHIGEAFAVPAAVAVLNARVLMQARRLAEQLQTALDSRAVIDQAIGIIRSRRGGSADDAFGFLRTSSQSTNTRLSAVARSIVEEAARRARARHSRP